MPTCASYVRVIAGLLIVIVGACPVLAAPMVVNGDFESDVDGFGVWPGYTGGGNPENISGWTGEGGRGINPISTAHASPAPFRDNGDNQTHVAFLQGAAFIEQEIGGFVPGTEYTVGLDFNARNCCGDFPIGDVLINGNIIGSSTEVFPPPGAVIPVGETNPWYHADIDFTADAETLTLRVASRPAAGGDATLIVDNISIVPEPGAAILAVFGVGLLSVFRRRRKP